MEVGGGVCCWPQSVTNTQSEHRQRENSQIFLPNVVVLETPAGSNPHVFTKQPNLTVRSTTELI